MRVCFSVISFHIIQSGGFFLPLKVACIQTTFTSLNMPSWRSYCYTAWLGNWCLMPPSFPGFSNDLPTRFMAFRYCLPRVAALWSTASSVLFLLCLFKPEFCTIPQMSICRLLSKVHYDLHPVYVFGSQFCFA